MFKKILIRCDAAELAEVGTGHLYRSITIYKLLKKKFSLKKKDILFVIKDYGKFKISRKILQANNISFYSIKEGILDYSKRELEIINKFSSNLIIIDRWGSINKKFIIDLKKRHKKIILIDDSSVNRGFADLSINPLKTLIKKVQKNYIGYNYNILPAFEKRLNKPKTISKNSIFVSFGGFDANNLIQKTINYLLKKNFNFVYLINQKYKRLFNKSSNISFYKSQDHFQNLLKSEIVITAGGLSMFDAIYLNKKTICIPQYKHQIENINILNKRKVVYKVNYRNLNKLSLILNYFKNMNTNKKMKEKQKKIINYSLIKNTFNLIYKCYEK
jgi:spore coat polysaccharide biosynthesis predicted glycosyltransferase SpsG